MRRGKLDLVKHITSTRISSLTNKPLSYRTNSQPILKLLKIFIAMILFALCLNLVSAVDVGTCQVLSSSDVTYDLTASLDSDTGVCLNITGNNVTVDGHGYSIAYAKTGVGNAIHVEGQNSITLQHIRINQTSTARLTSPAVVFIDSEDNNIDNLTLSIAGEDSPDAYNHGINFQNVTNSTITKSDIDIETVCDYCYGIYLQQ